MPDFPADVEPRWTIDICATCGRLAAWPFCEHGQAAHASRAAARWTIPVQVKPAHPAQLRRRFCDQERRRA